MSRAVEHGMPYTFGKSSPSAGVSPPTAPPSVIPFETVEDFQELLTRIRLERDTWEKKFREVELENKELKEKVKEQESMIALRDGILLEKEDTIR
ncbi:hypothetical protein A2U01_0061203, partial [Trifolium medium]|nr:hypothetical protein [Trifolium medium]